MAPDTPVNKPATFQYFILAVLFLATVGYHANHIKFIADYLSGDMGIKQ